MSDRPARRRGPGGHGRSNRAHREEATTPSDPDRPRIPQPAAGRELALELLWESDASGRLISDLFDDRRASLSSQRSTDPRDIALTHELIAGVTRRQETLTAILRPQLNRPFAELEPGLVRLIQLGIYQLLFSDSIPAHAAVHETVQLCHRAERSRWAGFVNGVLRSVGRALTDRFVDQPAANAVPISEGRYRELGVAAFVDPAVNPVLHFSQAWSFPLWLVERWSQRWSWDELLAFGFWFNRSPRLCLRVNLRQVTRDEFLSQCAARNIAATPGTQREAVWIDGSLPITQLPGFTEGWFSVQDESAMAAGHAVDPRAGESILDLCAAPGGKTTHLAELSDDQASILAADVDPRRLNRVAENARRLRLNSIATVVLQRDLSNVPDVPFDAILLDVPCSNTGVLGKRAEARWRIQPTDLVELPALQRQLLQGALSRIKPGGRIVYSTCSIDPEENELLVRQFLQAANADPDRRKDLSLVLRSEHFHRPGQPGDGAYQAVIDAVRT